MSWAMLQHRQLCALREGDPTPCCTPIPALQVRSAPGTQHSLLSPQIGDRLQRRTLGEFLCMQHGKGWICKRGLPAWGQSTPSQGGHGDTGAQYSEVPCRAQYPSAWESQPWAPCREVSIGSGALPMHCPGGLHTARPKPSPGQQKTHSRSTGQDRLPGLGIQGHPQRQPAHKLSAQAAKHIFAFIPGELCAPSCPLLSDKPCTGYRSKLSTGGAAFQAHIPLACAPIQQIPNAPAAYQRTPPV